MPTRRITRQCWTLIHIHLYSQSFFSINLLYNGDVALFLFEDKDFFNRIQLILEEINLLYEGGDGPDGD